ncbi:MAG: hypothetical protein JWN27_1619 [Candidatus Eremiobacteraeota bacterium]|nr:hypothetical protein [Candidatus Eremiobacteraeota bacterium]
MRRAPTAGPDLGVYVQAIPLLVRNPSIIVIPLLMAVIGVLMGLVLSPYGGGGIGQATTGLAGFILQMLQLFGLGAACVIADDAWRNGHASFERGWSEARRRGSDLLMAALGVAIVTSLAQFVAVLVGSLIALVLGLVIYVFLIWAMPAAAVGGIPGGAAIGVSVERVRETPVPAVLTAIIAFALTYVTVRYASPYLTQLLLPYLGGATIVNSLIDALLRAIAAGYIALIVTRTYTGTAFTRRW